MPEVSRFYGIVIQMYFREHNPPHFHARYSGSKASINIESLALEEGTLPPRALSLVNEWAALHQAELLDNWKRARSGRALAAIEPLT